MGRTVGTVGTGGTGGPGSVWIMDTAPNRKSQVTQAGLAAPRALAPSQWDPAQGGHRTLLGGISAPLSNAPAKGAS